MSGHRWDDLLDPRRRLGAADGVSADGAGGGHDGRGDEGGGGQGANGHVAALPAVRRDLPAFARETMPDPYRSYGPAAEAGYHDPGIDYRKYLGVVVKHRWLILGSAGICVFLGVLFTLLQTPVYRASATLQIKREVVNLLGVAGLDAVETGRGNEFYQTQYELLKSRALAERVVSALDLARNDAFAGGAPSSWATLRGALFGGADAGGGRSLAERERRAVIRVMDGVTVAPVRASSVVRVSFDSDEPRLAQRVADAVAENFIVSNLERSYDATAHARTFLQERLQELKLNLEESEKELVAYAEANQIIVTGQDQSLIATNLGDANKALTAAGKELLRHHMLWEQAQAAPGLGLPQLLENKAVEALRTRRAELSADYQDKLRMFKPDFPDMVQLRARIGELDRQVAAEVGLIKESLKSRYLAALEEHRSLGDRVEKLKSEVMDFQSRNIRHNILKRAVDTNRTLYDGLLQRYKELGLAGGIDANNLASNISIVDRAELPVSPYKPRLALNVAVALALGLMLGGAAAFAREHFDDTFKAPEELEDALGLPLLGVIPLSQEMDGLGQGPAGPRSAPAEAFRSLRTALQFSTSAGVPPSLLVTSSRPSEGKSTTAVAVARNFAQLGLRVLLIDADLRKPSLHEHLRRDPASGLSNCLVGQARPPQVLQATDQSHLTFLACGPLPPNPSELLAGPRMASLLAAAGEKFDLVVVDGPPVAGLADAPLLASMTAGTLLVVEANGTRRAVATAALKRLYFARGQMVGVVLNKFDAGKAGFSYGYGYGHGYGYGEAGYYGYGADPAVAAGEAREARGWLPFLKRSA